jgi:hypothetical protein
MTEWRGVRNFEGVYEVSDDGQVKRVAPGPRTYPGKILTPRPSKKGYLRVVLCWHGSQRDVFIHVLVAEAFLKRIVDHNQVNHLDGNKANNHVSNLEWTTPKGNMTHARLAGLWNPHQHAGEHNGNAKLTVSDVLTIRTSVEPSTLLAKKFGVTTTSIDYIRNGDGWADVTSEVEAMSTADRIRFRAQARETCRRNHALTPDNTYTNPRSVRCCRTCTKENRARKRKSQVVS